MRVSMSMQIKLECGHKTIWIYRVGTRILPDRFTCQKCEEESKPVAAETREFRATCAMQGCKWSRWAGQSEMVARERKREHWTRHRTHVCSIAYAPVPDKVDVVRESYGKRFPIGIIGNPVKF